MGDGIGSACRVPEEILVGGKPAVRAWARAIRAAIPTPLVSEDIGNHLRTSEAFRASQNVLLYCAVQGEPDVLELAHVPGKQFHLPVCKPGRRLEIRRFVPGQTPLRTGPFGILEPAEGEPVPPDTLDLIVLPALAMDLSGRRLGYGGGYYDRFLRQFRTGIETVAVVPDVLLVEALPLDPWDISVKSVCTDARFLPIMNGGDAEAMV